MRRYELGGKDMGRRRVEWVRTQKSVLGVIEIGWRRGLGAHCACQEMLE
jgi:hypothetical protein